MERVVLRVAAEIGKITLWSHSEGITTNLIESSSPWKRITGKAIKIRFNHWQELWSLSKGRRRTFEAIFSLFWDNFLSDQWIRDAVRGYKIEFKEIQFNTDYLTKCLSLETRKSVFQWGLENCWERVRRVVRLLIPTNSYRIYSQFQRKATSCALLIWNHWTIEYRHFKMEGLTLLVLIRPNDYMITMDLKDAFLSVPICSDNSKYLPFWMGIRAMGFHLSSVWAVVGPSSVY